MLNKALLVALFCSTALVLPRGSVQASEPVTNPTSSAENLAREGLKLARGKKYEAAAKRFEAAFKLDPRAIYAHNLARALEELGNLTRAFDFFTQALRLDSEYNFASEGRRKIGVLEKKLEKTHGRVKIMTTPAGVGLTVVEANGTKTQHLRSPHLRWVVPGTLTIRAEKLGFTEGVRTIDAVVGKTYDVAIVLKPLPKKGYLNVSSTEKDARVLLDGEDIGPAPIKGRLVAAGNHRIAIIRNGTTLLEREIVVVPDKPFTVSHNRVNLPHPDASETWLPTTLWIAGGLLCVTGVALHVAAADSFDSIENYPIIDEAKLDTNRRNYETLKQEIEAQNALNATRAKEARSTGKSLEAAAWVGYSVALSAAVVGTLLYMRDVDNPPQLTSKEVPSYSLLPTVSVGSKHSSLGLAISF